nr:CDP-alcohol phosphatidyltransferase family protein [Rhodospira trueperi]
MRWAHLPNALTAMRLVLVAPILWCLMRGWDWAAFLLFLVAGLTDALDGALARRLNARTALGALLDPLADKALVSGVFIVLALRGDLPAWLAVLVIGRDLALVAGAILIRLGGGAFAPRPTRISRANTLAQIVLVAVALATPILSDGLTKPVLAILVPIVAVTTLASGLDYGRAALSHMAGSTRSRGGGGPGR